MKYEIVLGLEIHIQLKTSQKMFCTCKNDPFYSAPNSNVCPVCLGLPGAMPVPNIDAIQKAQKVAYALGSKLSNQIIFERKNYFYPDLPKGFQLTSPHYPISVGGSLDMTDVKSGLQISFREIHIEEDTAKSHHDKTNTYIDFNKSGVPLLEIVTEPDFRNVEDGVLFCKEVQLIAQYLDCSDADMEKGNMRLEANLSLRPFGESKLPDYRVELKNINSFTFMKKALEYEIKRQEEALEKGEKLYQETRGYDERTGKTFIQRSKEEPNDYRYFPEPDIPPIEFTDIEIAGIKNGIKETPSKLRKKIKELGIPDSYSSIIVSNKSYLDKITKLIVEFKYDPKKATTLCIDSKEYHNKTAQEINEIEKGKQNNKISDENELIKFIQKVLEDNPESVKDYKSGKQNALQFLIGQVMRISKGNADPTILRTLLQKELNN